jgi:hypothetical protein
LCRFQFSWQAGKRKAARFRASYLFVFSPPPALSFLFPGSTTKQLQYTQSTLRFQCIGLKAEHLKVKAELFVEEKRQALTASVHRNRVFMIRCHSSSREVWQPRRATTPGRSLAHKSSQLDQTIDCAFQRKGDVQAAAKYARKTLNGAQSNN